MQRWGRSLPRLWRGLRPGLQGEGKPIFPLEDVKAFATVTPGDLGAISGAPEEAYKRKVTIFSPARSATQQAVGKALEPKPAWRMEFSTQEKWENPLIGWTSTADPLEHVGRAALHFRTAEEAIRFCEEHGWNYEVLEPHLQRTTRAKRFMGYGDNFSTKRAGLPDGGLISEGTAQPVKRSPDRKQESQQNLGPSARDA